MGFFEPVEFGTEKRKIHRLPQCGACGLYKGCRSPKMPPGGQGDRPILFVGEAPGKTEDKEGEQFVGVSGQKLEDVLYELNFELNDGCKTNAIICRPPKNKMQAEYIEFCRPNLLKTIRRMKPNVIVLLGGKAVRSLVCTEIDSDAVISKWAGWAIPSLEYGAWICPTYHPSHLLREKDPVLNLLFSRHLQQAIGLEHEEVKGLDLEELKRDIERITNPRQAAKRLKDLSKKAGTVAFDYETTGLKPDDKRHWIVAASFCLGGEDTFAVKMNEDLLPLLSRVLRSDRLRKVTQNLKYEERWTRAILGHPVSNWYWDTMLTAHILDNRSGVTGLKFQAYVQFGVPDYNSAVTDYMATREDGLNRMWECPDDILLTYNGLDSLLTYKLMERQRTLMRFKGHLRPRVIL